MKITIKTEVEKDIKTLEVSAGIRYFEDTEVNGIEDTDGTLIPCKKGEMWCPIIDIETGVITNWEQGKKANVHYKVCDQFCCILKDVNGMSVLEAEDKYVPKIMCPKDDGYGDYIIMEIDENGKIHGWDASLIADMIDYLSE